MNSQAVPFAKRTLLAIALLSVAQAGWAADSSGGNASTPTSEAVTAAREAKEIADAQKAAADARKAEEDAKKAAAEARTAAFKASIGEVPSSGITGAVEAKEKAGNAEAMLLASQALNQWAAEAIKTFPDAPKSKTPLLVFAGTDVPSFQALSTFRTQGALLKKLAEGAEKLSIEADQGEPAIALVAPPAAVLGLGLDAITKLLAFFRSDFTVGGIEVKLEDAMLASAMASAVAVSTKNYVLSMPGVYSAALINSAQNLLTDELEKLTAIRVRAQLQVAHHQDRVTRSAEAAKRPGISDSDLKTINERADRHKKALDAWKGLLTSFDALLAKFSGPDEKGVWPLAVLAKEAAVADVLGKNGRMLYLKLHSAGGTYYTQKNLWTTFGVMPFYVMGGVVASYTLFEGSSGTVVATRMMPIHGGFVKAKDVQATLDAAARAADADLKAAAAARAQP